jgi:hypothetical protein
VSNIEDDVFNRRMFYETPEAQKFMRLSEENVKVKFIFPLFEILGWNVRNHLDAELEYDCGYDKEVYQRLLRRFSPSYDLKKEKWDKGLVVDCAFKTRDGPYILLEAKRFDSDLPSIVEPNGFRLVENARRFPDVKYVVFTKFIKMSIVDMKSGQPTTFEDTSEYISKYDSLKALLKSDAQEEHIVFVPKQRCFENFVYRPKECENCVDIQRYMCEATTKLRQLGYEPELIQ